MRTYGHDVLVGCDSLGVVDMMSSLSAIAAKAKPRPNSSLHNHSHPSFITFVTHQRHRVTIAITVTINSPTAFPLTPTLALPVNSVSNSEPISYLNCGHHRAPPRWRTVSVCSASAVFSSSYGLAAIMHACVPVPTGWTRSDDTQWVR